MKKQNRYSGVILTNKKRSLLCKRSKDGSFPGEWSVPSGSIEYGESPITAAKREFKEETDITLSPNLSLVGMIIRNKKDGANDKGTLYVFHQDSEDVMIPNLDTAKDGHEHTECGYFKKNELPTPIDSELKELIKKLI